MGPSLIIDVDSPSGKRRLVEDTAINFLLPILRWFRRQGESPYFVRDEPNFMKMQDGRQFMFVVNYTVDARNGSLSLHHPDGVCGCLQRMARSHQADLDQS